MPACQVGSEVGPAEGLPPTAAISGDSLGVTLKAPAPCLCHMNVFSGPQAYLAPSEKGHSPSSSRSWRTPPPFIMAEALLVREGHRRSGLGLSLWGAMAGALGLCGKQTTALYLTPPLTKWEELAAPLLAVFCVGWKEGWRLQAPAAWAGGSLACCSATSLLVPRLGLSPLLFGFFSSVPFFLFNILC